MSFLTAFNNFIALIEKLVAGYRAVKKEKKKEDLKDEVRKRDDDDTVAALRDLGL